MTTTDYEQQAQDFATNCGLTMTIKYIGFGPHFIGDNESRHRYSITLKRHGKRMTFKFGQSISAGKQEPTLYSVLACLQKYEVEGFEDFCSEFGYNTDSRTDHKIYLAVEREYRNVKCLFSDVLEQLQEF